MTDAKRKCPICHAEPGEDSPWPFCSAECLRADPTEAKDPALRRRVEQFEERDSGAGGPGGMTSVGIARLSWYLAGAQDEAVEAANRIAELEADNTHLRKQVVALLSDTETIGFGGSAYTVHKDVAARLSALELANSIHKANGFSVARGSDHECSVCQHPGPTKAYPYRTTICDPEGVNGKEMPLDDPRTWRLCFVCSSTLISSDNNSMYKSENRILGALANIILDAVATGRDPREGHGDG